MSDKPTPVVKKGRNGSNGRTETKKYDIEEDEGSAADNTATVPLTLEEAKEEEEVVPL